MATPRSFAVSPIATGVPSVKVRGMVNGYPMGRWQHFFGLSGRSDVTDLPHAERRLSSVLSYWERGDIILTSSAKSRTLPCISSGRLSTYTRNRKWSMTEPWGKTTAYTEWMGESIVYTNPEGTMRAKRAVTLDDHRMSAIGIQLDAKIAVVYRFRSSGEVKTDNLQWSMRIH